MYEDKEDKSNRALSIYSRLMNGRAINKSEEAKRFRVSEKSIQRDIEGIKTFLDNQAASEGIPNNLVYDYKMKAYRIEQSDDVKLTNDEILAICKILLASRAFSKEEMNSMIDKIIDFCVPIKNQKVVKKLLISERYHYVELTNKQKILDKMMVLGEAISSQYVIEFDYKGVQGHTNKHRSVEPYAIMFSDFYFYLVGRIRDINPEIAFANPQDAFPTIYRMDRLKNLKVTGEHFSVPYRNKFEEGEYRKRIQFMRGGKNRKIKFEYSGFAVEAVLDRLPTARIIGESEGKYIVEAEVFGDGIDMWIRSQGDAIRIL